MSSLAINFSLEQISSIHWCRTACELCRGNDVDRNLRLSEGSDVVCLDPELFTEWLRDAFV